MDDADGDAKANGDGPDGLTTGSARVVRRPFVIINDSGSPSRRAATQNPSASAP
jgi:hypothetical protein